MSDSSMDLLSSTISSPNSMAMVVYNLEIAQCREKDQQCHKRELNPRKSSSSARATNCDLLNPVRRSKRTCKLDAPLPSVSIKGYESSMGPRTRASTKFQKSDTPLAESKNSPQKLSTRLIGKRPRESQQQLSAKKIRKLPRKSPIEDEPQPPQPSELRTKRRHEAFSQPPFHLDFFTASSKRRFDKFFKDQDLLIEKPFLIDAPSVFEILQANQLENCILNSGKFNKSIVAEFYANIGPSVTDESSPFCHKVYVRGVWVNLTSDAINDVLGSPSVFSGFSLELERPQITPSEIVKTLTQNKVHSWSGSLLPSSKLSSTFALLNKLCKSQWIPSSHVSDITLREAMLLYILASKMETVDIGSVICENILERANQHKQKKLTHPVLISRLLKKQDVPFRSSDIILNVPAPLGTNKRLSSGNRVNDFPQTPTERAEAQQSFLHRLKHKIAHAINDCQTMKMRLSSLLYELDQHGGDI